MRSVTVTLDEETFAKARLRAAQRNLSVSRFVTEVLAEELRHGDAYDVAFRAWLAVPSFALKGAPQTYPKREELYDRALLRRR
jgi:hypothetical protein